MMADKEAKHGQVVQLMDSAKNNGFGKLAIATEQKKKWGIRRQVSVSLPLSLTPLIFQDSQEQDVQNYCDINLIRHLQVR